MSRQLAAGRAEPTQDIGEPGAIDIHLSDSTKLDLPEASVDFVLTSPPYCTRIDYTAATRIRVGRDRAVAQCLTRRALAANDRFDAGTGCGY